VICRTITSARRTPISQATADPKDRKALLAHVRSLPPAMIAYQGMTEYADALMDYLEQKKEQKKEQKEQN